MLDQSTVESVARNLYAAHRDRESYRPLPDGIRNAPLEDAYRIQDAFQEVLVEKGAGPIAGHKIALTSRAMQEMVGVDQPCAGPILEGVVQASPAGLALSSFQHVGVEFEVAVRLREDLSPGTGEHTRESVADSVASCMAAYELIEDRNADYATMDVFSLVADNCWNGGVVLGDPVTDWSHLDLEQARTRLTIDGRAAGEGRTGDALGHPFEALAWLANLLNRRGKSIARDMIVMTGSSITTKFPAAGERFEFSIEGLGGVQLEWRA